MSVMKFPKEINELIKDYLIGTKKYWMEKKNNIKFEVETDFTWVNPKRTYHNQIDEYVYWELKINPETYYDNWEYYFYGQHILIKDNNVYFHLLHIYHQDKYFDETKACLIRDIRYIDKKENRSSYQRYIRDLKIQTNKIITRHRENKYYKKNPILNDKIVIINFEKVLKELKKKILYLLTLL